MGEIKPNKDLFIICIMRHQLSRVAYVAGYFVHAKAMSGKAAKGLLGWKTVLSKNRKAPTKTTKVVEICNW